MFPGTVLWWAKINKPRLEETVRKLELTWDDIVPVLQNMNTAQEFFDCFNRPEVVFKSLLEKNKISDEAHADKAVDPEFWWDEFPEEAERNVALTKERTKKRRRLD